MNAWCFDCCSWVFFFVGGILHKDDLSSKQASKLHFNGKVGWKKKNRTRRLTSSLLSSQVWAQQSKRKRVDKNCWSRGFPALRSLSINGSSMCFFGWGSCSKVSRSTSTKFSGKQLAPNMLVTIGLCSQADLQGGRKLRHYKSREAEVHLQLPVGALKGTLGLTASRNGWF